MPTRRAVLLGGAAAAALAVAGCSSDDEVTGSLVSGSFASRYRHGVRTGWSDGRADRTVWPKELPLLANCPRAFSPTGAPAGRCR